MRGDTGAPRRRPGASRALLSAVWVLCALGLTGCLRLQAKTVPAPPPLDAPEAPERVVEVVDPAMPPIVSLPDEPARPGVPPRTRPPAPRAEGRPSDPKPAENAADVPKPEDVNRLPASVPPP